MKRQIRLIVAYGRIQDGNAKRRFPTEIAQVDTVTKLL